MWIRISTWLAVILLRLGGGLATECGLVCVGNAIEYCDARLVNRYAGTGLITVLIDYKDFDSLTYIHRYIVYCR